MLISLHLPKTAGMSFGKSLTSHFADDLLLDYEDMPMTKSKYDRAKEALSASINIGEKGMGNYKCVHGHFLPIKYLLLSEKKEVRFITWMRNPVERMLSQYHYWKRSYDPKRSAPHHKKFIEENWSLERFCLGPEFRNIYTQYLWGFPLQNFEFIGIVEHYQEDFIFFSRNFLKTSLPSFQINASGAIGSKYTIEDNLRKKIETYHKKDMNLYQDCLLVRKKR